MSSPTLRAALVLLPSCLLPACAPAPAPAPGPPAPDEVWLGDPVAGTEELLLEGPIAFAATLPGYRLLAQPLDGELLELGPLDSEPRSHGTAAGFVSAAAPLPDGATLVAGTGGLFVVEPWGLAPSPLSAVYTPTPDARLLSSGSDLWIADDALRLWRDGALFTLAPGDLPATDPQIAFGSPVQGFPAMWVASEGLVYALVAQGDAFVTWEEAGALDGAALGVDGVHDLWVALDEPSPELGAPGDLRRRLPDGSWQWFRLPSPARSVAAGPGSASWFATDDGTLIRQDLDTWLALEIDGAPALRDGDTPIGSDAAGRLLIAGPDGLRRVSVDRPLIVHGLADGQALESPVTLTVLPTLASRAVSLDLRLDGAPIDPTPITLGARSAWTLSLDPALLSDGAHELSLSVRWDDEVQADDALFFSVGAFVPPTWTEDIEPLNELACLSCHSANGGAHLLDTRARWEAEIDGILDNVISGAMPLSGDKLDADEIRTLQLWRAGGFQE